MGAWQMDPADIGRDDGEQSERIDHQTDAEKSSLPALSATDHADGAVEEDQQKPQQHEIANNP